MSSLRGKAVRHALEYAGVLGALGVVRALPAPVACAFGAGVADLAYLSIGMRRRVAIANILAAGVADCPREAARIARASFRHFAVCVVEAIRFRALLDSGRWRERVEVHQPPELGDPGARSGVVLASGHFGNYLVAGHVLSRFRPLAGIRRPMDNARVDAVVRRLFYGERFEGLPKHGAGAARFIEVLRGGKALAVMIDQHAGRRGMLVDFMGRPASCHTGIALLALVAGVPIYFGYCLRTGPMRYLCRATGPIPCERTGDRERDTRAILARLNGELEGLVRAHPEQYLWAHRRWRPGAHEGGPGERPNAECGRG